MKFEWRDYDSGYAALIEQWFDEETRRSTGCDDGFALFDEYWRNDADTVPGENYWCKLVCAEKIPFAVIAAGMWDEKLSVMEIVTAPEKRGRGFGSAALAELISEGETIIGHRIMLAEAVIFPDNKASLRAFEKAGFRFRSAHPDGDAFYYSYRAPEKGLSVCSQSA